MHQLLAFALVLGSLVPLGCTRDRNVSAAPEDGASAVSQEVIAIVDVHVLPMDSARVLEAQTVLVRDGMIAEVGPSTSVEIPPEARLIDGRGLYLLPGLTDFHVHLRSTDELLSYLYYGVTTVVHMSGAMSGAPNLLRYREQLASGEMIGPRLLTTGPILDGDPPVFAGVSVAVSRAEEARRIVADQKRAGYDFIKVYNNLPPDVLSAVTEAARAHDMAVIGHIPRTGGRANALQRALAAGLDVIAHSEEYFFTYFYAGVDSLLDLGRLPAPDETLIPEAVRMTKESGTAVVPNLSFVAMTREQLDDLSRVLTHPETAYLHPDVLEMWEEQNPTRRSDLARFDLREQAKYSFLMKLTKAMHDGGVLLLLGTDASAPGLFPGKSAHVELREMVAAGLTPFEALAAGTRNAGAFVGEHVSDAEPFGLVAPGHRADVILVQGNPLDSIENVSNIRGVMTRGTWWPREELETMREEVASSYSAR